MTAQRVTEYALPLPSVLVAAHSTNEVRAQPQITFRATDISVYPSVPSLYITSVLVGQYSQLLANYEPLSAALLPPAPWCNAHADCRSSITLARDCYVKTGLDKAVEEFRRKLTFDTCQVSQLMTVRLWNDSDEDMTVHVCFYGKGVT